MVKFRVRIRGNEEGEKQGMSVVRERATAHRKTTTTRMGARRALKVLGGTS